MNDAWSFHFLWIDVVIQVACVVSWTSMFTCQMIVVADLFICSHEWFGADGAVGGVDVFPPLFLGQSFHRDFGQVLSPYSCCSEDLVQKLFSSVIPDIHLGCFKVSPITAFHVVAASTWYVLLVLGDEGF